MYVAMLLSYANVGTAEKKKKNHTEKDSDIGNEGRAGLTSHHGSNAEQFV